MLFVLFDEPLIAFDEAAGVPACLCFFGAVLDDIAVM